MLLLLRSVESMTRSWMGSTHGVFQLLRKLGSLPSYALLSNPWAPCVIGSPITKPATMIAHLDHKAVGRVATLGRD